MPNELRRKSDRQTKPQRQQPNASNTSAEQGGNQAQAKGASKLDMMTAMLGRPEGASLAELAEATGWQKHSIRGAMAGTLKKKGYAVRSEPAEGGRRYRIGAAG